MVETVIRETLLLLEVEDKCPDFVPADLPHIGAHAFRGEEIVKIAGAVDNNGNSIGAFPFGSSAEPIAVK
jgi:hypothetical protein